MEIQCTLNFKYQDPIEAETVVKAVKVDNYNFVDTKVTKNEIVSNIESKTISSLIHTLDDYLSCLSLAERVVSKIPDKSH
jgi:hypothetical protein